MQVGKYVKCAIRFRGQTLKVSCVIKNWYNIKALL